MGAQENNQDQILDIAQVSNDIVNLLSLYETKGKVLGGKTYHEFWSEKDNVRLHQILLGLQQEPGDLSGQDKESINAIIPTTTSLLQQLQRIIDETEEVNRQSVETKIGKQYALAINILRRWKTGHISDDKKANSPRLDSTVFSQDVTVSVFMHFFHLTEDYVSFKIETGEFLRHLRFHKIEVAQKMIQYLDEHCVDLSELCHDCYVEAHQKLPKDVFLNRAKEFEESNKKIKDGIKNIQEIVNEIEDVTDVDSEEKKIEMKEKANRARIKLREMDAEIKSYRSIMITEFIRYMGKME